MFGHVIYHCLSREGEDFVVDLSLRVRQSNLVLLHVSLGKFDKDIASQLQF